METIWSYLWLVIKTLTQTQLLLGKPVSTSVHLAALQHLGTLLLKL